MKTADKLGNFLNQHSHALMTCIDLVFTAVGVAIIFQGINMICGCFVAPVTIGERAWWQLSYPPPVSKALSYPVRVLYVLAGFVAIGIGVAFFYGLFIL